MKRATTTTRKADKKGRITLGEEFSNRTVIVEQHEDHIVLRRAAVIPESEAWLYRNEKALASLRRGLEQARNDEFAAPPDLDQAEKLASEIDNEDSELDRVGSRD